MYKNHAPGPKHNIEKVTDIEEKKNDKLSSINAVRYLQNSRKKFDTHKTPTSTNPINEILMEEAGEKNTPQPQVHQ